MAKVTAPLLSFRSRGQIGKTAVFASWRGVQYARQHVIPSNPKTTAQTVTRTTFAFLREVWKLLGSEGRAPWDAFASGRKFLGLNSFVGENLRVVRNQPDLANFIGSPGARGGLPPVSVVASAGVGTGEIDLTFTNPDAPEGWTLEAIAATALPDQDPSGILSGPVVTGEEVAPATTITLSGFGSAEQVVVAGWLRWTKPNGETAYSVGITDVANAGA